MYLPTFISKFKDYNIRHEKTLSISIKENHSISYKFRCIIHDKFIEVLKST